MSFNFGGATTTSGGTFGTANPTTGFSFGGGDANKSLFGGTNAVPAPATTTTSSLFGASKPLSFGGFTSPPNQTVGSPGFGQPLNQNAQPQNLSFGSATQAQAAPPPFGSPATQATFGSPGSGFSFKPASTTAAGFSFNTPTSGFSAPQQAATVTTSTIPQTSKSAFGTTTSSTLSFGGSAFGAKPGAFSFGNTQQATAFGPPAATTSNAAPSFGTPVQSTFGMGQQTTAQTTAQATAQTTAQTTAQPNFGATSTGLGFGTSQAATTPAFGTATNQPSGLTLGAPTTQPSFGFGSVSGTSVSAPAAPVLEPAGLSFSTSTPPPTFGTPTGQPAVGLNSSTPGQTSTGLSFSTASQPAAGFGFGKPSAPATTGLNFGTTPSSVSSCSVSTTPTPGLGFGSTCGTLTSASTSTGLGFGVSSTAGLTFGTTSAPSTQPGMYPGGPLSTPSLGLKPTTTAVSSAASTTAPSGITALAKPTTTTTTTTTTMPALTAATTTSTLVPPQQISSITFAQLEENINKWTLELEEQERTFINQATQINAWDTLLIANGEKIVELNDAVEAVKNEQQSLEHELDFVLAQQKELEDILTPMEKQLLEENVDRLRDPEREHMYSLAENLDTQLRQMSEDLKEVIEHLNETNRSQDSSDPIVQIGRILNAHMSSMQWTDNSIAQISTKLDQLKATHDTLRRDNERSFQLTYN